MKNLKCLIVVFLCLPFFSFSQTDSSRLTGGSFIYTFPRSKPGFPGGRLALVQFFKRNSAYPVPNLKDGLWDGRDVWLHLVVEKNGSISSIKLVRSAGDQLDAEAIRITKLLPRFTPAKNAGKPVRCYYDLHIAFQ